MQFPEIGKNYFFPVEEYQQRLAAVRAKMAERGIEVLLCTERENIYYLSGHQTFSFSTFQLLAVPRDGEPALIVRYFESMQAHHHSWLTDIVTWDDTDDPVGVTIEALKQRGWHNRTTGVEETGSFLDVTTWKKLGASIPHLVDGSRVVESCRAAKSPREIAHMKEAARYTDAGMRAAVDEIKPGVNENDVAAAAFDAMTRAGSEWLAKDPIVTSGERAGIPHTTYRRRVLKDQDTVLLEFSGVHHRYFCPMMRTVFIGKPDPQIDRLAKICIEALDAAIAAVRAGATAGDVDAACVAVINREGLWENYRKRTGYSVGCGFLSWMEVGISSLKADDPTVLAPGMCFHLPIAVRLYGEAGLGFSETMLVTETGAEPIGKFPRAFVHR
jgi:Xaa-Pro dipeptidase